jgi:hypothetical protein
MRRAIVVLVVAGGLAALFATASRTPARQRSTRIVYTKLVVVSCNKPPASLSAACAEASTELKEFPLDLEPALPPPPP